MSYSVIKFIDRSTEGPRKKRKQNLHACEGCRKRKKRCLHDYGEVHGEPPSPVAPSFAPSTSSFATSDSSLGLPCSVSSATEPRISNEPETRPRAQESTLEGNNANQDSSNVCEVVHRPRNNRTWTTRSSSPISACENVEHTSSRSSLEPDAGDDPTFVGHLNPEGVFLAVTRVGPSRASRYDDNLGFWLPKKRNRRAGNNEQQDLNCRPKSPLSKIAKPAVPAKPSWTVKALPDPHAFNALRALYFKDIHPLFPILPPELIPEMTTSSELSPTEIILMQSLCFAVATNSAARPFLRLQHIQGILTPKAFAVRLSQALLTGLNMTSRIERMVCLRVLTILSLFSQLSTNDHASAEYCARAVSYVQTMQLHLDTAHVRKDDVQVTQVFLCVWALDRLNVAFHSRPLLIHTRDIGRNMEACIAQQEGCFRALLLLCGLLEEVTDLYRPSCEPNAYDHFRIPSFEDLLIKSNTVACQPRFVATIETLYHAVVMLTYRFLSLDDPDRSSISYLRSNLSADRLVTLMGTEDGTSFPNFPFVPYAISLALRVSYRELRFTKTPHYRSVARSQLLTVSGLLEKFGDGFSFARRLAALAAKTIREMDKVAASVLHERNNEADSIRAISLSRPEDENSNSTNHAAEASDDATAAQQESNVINSMANGPDHPQSPEIPQYDATHYNAESFNLLHKISDLPDPFERFDPEFNLNAVDLTLMQNIGASNLPDFSLSPEMDWVSCSEMSNVFSSSTDNYGLPSVTTW